MKYNVGYKNNWNLLFFETVAFDYMMWKDEMTNTYLCLILYYNIRYMTSLRVKGGEKCVKEFSCGEAG